MVCSIESEPIPGPLRLAWVRELATGCNVVHCAEALPQEPKDSADFWPIWRAAIRRHVPDPIDFVFASEPYGERLAAELDATFIPFDLQRELCSTSGTAIRTDPLANWAFIPECVRPHFVKRIAILGPESTGKSTLARNLASAFNTTYAWEHARPLLDLKQGRCDPPDIELIARSQLALEETMARRANRVLLCDTTLLLTKVWSEVLFGACPPWIAHAAQRRYDLTLLLDVDVPWVDDTQRYFPDQPQREAFFNLCRSELDRLGHKYFIIRGDYASRTATAIDAIRETLRINPAAATRPG